MLRYETKSICSTKLDPLEDCTAWIRGLRSADYTSDLLRQKHRFVDADKIRNSTRAIAAHAESSVDLFEQAFSGAPRASYLPIYYAMLNLAKIAVICSGSLNQLHNQRLHGAQWSGIRRASQDLLTDHITVHERGAIALFYKALVGHMWPKSGQKNTAGNWISTYKRRIYLRAIYPFINSVSFEYGDIYGENTYLVQIDVQARKVSTDRWRLEVEFPKGNPPTGSSKQQFKILTGLTLDGNRYISTTVGGTNAAEARVAFADRFRWYLIYTEAYPQGLMTFTPRSNSNFLLPKEIPILLAFFHLSNVVRYDPERLERLFDSRACGMLEVLRRHATYDFLVAMWSFFVQSQVALMGI